MQWWFHAGLLESLGGDIHWEPSSPGLPSKAMMSSDAIFARIFRPVSTQLHFTLLTPHLFPFMLIFLYHFMPFTLMNKRQEHDLIGTTGHRTTQLLGYRHSKTVLLWSLLTWILHGNFLCCH